MSVSATRERGVPGIPGAVRALPLRFALRHIAREGGCKGILFDIEQYTFQLFNYRKQRDAATKSWDEYAAQVRKRGREVMEA